MERILIHLKSYKKELFFGPLFKLLEAIIELILPTIMAKIIDVGIVNMDKPYVYKMGGLMVAMATFGVISALTCQYLASKTSQGFGTKLRNAMFSHIQSFSHSEVDYFTTPSLINRVTNDINQLQQAVAMLIRLVIRAPFICIGAFVMAMILNVKLSLILLLTIPIFSLILYLIISNSIPLYRKIQKKLDGLGTVLRENLSGVRVIRAFAKTQEETERFKNANADLTKTAVRVGKISALLSPLTTVVLNFAIVAVLWAGGKLINIGGFTQGELVAYVNYITQILLALIVVSNLVILFTKASASAGRVSEVLAVEPTIANANGCRQDNAHDVECIRFEHVFFAYSKGGESALEDINITINKGETVGIIGGTGAGKSTFVNLMPRFYDATSGRILIDGMDIRNMDLPLLRNKFGFVQQKALLFTGTIRENIAWGKPDATDEEIIQAAKIAQAHDFIMALENGYDTLLSQGGVNLSGGQKQRLTIARALVRKPEILILDDSLSALDFATDAKLRRALLENCKGSIVLQVTQRASSIRYADKIIVFDDGKIVGVGTHNGLMGQCEVYREIYMSQLEKEEAIG